MIWIMVGAWLFCLVSFCAVGVGCRIACRKRQIRGKTCICGRHDVKTATLSPRGPVPAALEGRPSRLRAAETRVRALQRRYVDGRLSMEQYETELDRLVGLA